MHVALTNADLWGVEGDTLVLRDGLIEAIGWEDSLRQALEGAREVDVEGASIIPALHESHAHPYVYGKHSIDLRGVRSVEELVRILKSFITRGNHPYVIGRGWDHELFKERRMPCISDLDRASEEVPIIIIRFCGHVGVINSAMLKHVSEAGAYGRLAKYLEVRDGRPTGIVIEDGIQIVLNTLPKPSLKERVEGVARLLREYLSYGVTYVNFMSVSMDELPVIDQAVSSVESVNVAAYVDEADVVGRPDVRGLPSSVGRVAVAGVKTFADGSLGGRTAYLREPYSDSDTRGVLLKRSSELLRLWERVRGLRPGAELAIHAIGDAALDEVLKFIRDAGGAEGIRVEHASLAPPDVIEGLSESGVRVAVQPHFLVSDWWVERRLGRRARWVYPFRSMLKSGVMLHGSSDYPVEPLNPYLGMSAACSRGMLQYLGLTEALSVEEALSLYLRDPFFGATSLSGGARADIVILDARLRSVKPYDLAAVRPAAVIVGGRVKVLGVQSPLVEKLSQLPR